MSKKDEEIEEMEYIDLDGPDEEEEIKFMIWKAEMNKELKSFWKHIME